VAAVEPPDLPRRARRHAKQLLFVRRREPLGERAEDVDTARLVVRVQSGDREAFGPIYTRYFPRVYGYLRVALRDRDEAEDLTQEVFANALARIGKYKRGARPFRAWLFTIARNEAINQLRRSGRLEVEDPAELDARRDQAVEDDEPESLAIDWIKDPDLLLFVERLPDPQRQVLAMRYLLGLRTQEIARVLDRTPNDVSKLQHRALEFLRERLKAIGREPARREKRINSRTRPKQAEVLRARRWALYE
jgi:RNA polymerase sigma-70 factor (ECF subfamily)